MKASQITDKMIRRYYGHNVEGNVRVRITQEGEVHRYGSRVDTDRSNDYWHYWGTRAEAVLNILDSIRNYGYKP